MKRKIKVAYIFTPIIFGGSEKVNLNFLKKVDRNKFEIKPILFVRPWENEPIVGAELRKNNYKYLTVPVALKEFGDPLRVFRAAYRVLIILDRIKPNLVHAHGYFASICSLPLARLMGMQCISTCHGFISTDEKLNLYNKLEKLSLRVCRKVIAVSENIKDDLTMSGIRPSRVVVIENAVPTISSEQEIKIQRDIKRRTLGIDLNEIVVGYAGRLSEEKGLEYLIQAAYDLLKEGESIKTIIIGEGPQRKYLEDLSKEKKMQHNVVFVGFQMEIEKWLPTFDIFVLPSLTEGTPMALLEAMSVGVPVIATSVGGVPKIVKDGINGFVVQPCDSRAISNRIGILMSKKGTREKMGREASKTIQIGFGIDAWCRKIEIQYERLVRN